MQVFSKFLHFNRDSNNKNSEFLKRLESSAASLSARPFLNVTYPDMLNKDFSSIFGNVLLSGNASSSMKISPSVKPAVQHSSFEWLTTFSIPSLLNSFNICRAKVFIILADWRKIINSPSNLSLRKLPGKTQLWYLFNISLIAKTIPYKVKCKTLLLVHWVKHITRPLYGLLEVSIPLNFSASSKMDSSLWSSADSKGFPFSSFILNQASLDLTLIQLSVVTAFTNIAISLQPLKSKKAAVFWLKIFNTKVCRVLDGSVW